MVIAVEKENDDIRKKILLTSGLINSGIFVD